MMKSHHNLVTSLSLCTLDIIKPEGIPTQSYSLPERQPAVERLVITKVLNNLSEKGDEMISHIAALQMQCDQLQHMQSVHTSDR